MLIIELRLGFSESRCDIDGQSLTILDNIIVKLDSRRVRQIALCQNATSELVSNCFAFASFL